MKLLDCVVCDDIRHEIGGKVSLMGIFGDSIKLQIPKGTPRPVSLPLALYLRILVEGQETIPETFKVVVALNQNEFAKIEGNISVVGERPKMLGFVLPLKMLQVSEDAIMSIVATFYAGGKTLLEASPPYKVSIQILEIDLPRPKLQ